MEDIIFKNSKDSRELIRLKFISKRTYRKYYCGKSWPIVTQCLLFEDGILKCFYTITKHDKDANDLHFAYNLVSEKCISQLSNTYIQSQLRSLVVKRLKELF